MDEMSVWMRVTSVGVTQAPMFRLLLVVLMPHCNISLTCTSPGSNTYY
jgi:hypothetical protein